MTRRIPLTHTRPLWQRGAAATLLAVSLAVITACGGGGDASTGTASTSSGNTTAERATAYAAGPISGFGSIIVNGVRYDDSGASVSDDDGRARSRDQLKLGMNVEVEGTAVSTSAATGRALRIRYGSEIVGPVTAVNATAGTITVLGQVVTVSDTTVFDDSLTGGLSGIDTQDILEVHAQFNATDGSYRAVRVEDATSATTYKLRGTVANLNTTAKTFTIGGQVINYGSLAAADVPSNLADGATVRVRLQTTQVNGQWVATAARSGVNKPEDGLGGHLRGAITVFTSTASFEVNSVKVDASKASFPDGTTGITLGATVEVKGTVTNGVLVATSVELDGKHAKERFGFELHGAISALNTTAKTFKLRGLTVSYGTGTVTWKDGSEASLADGKQVEVKGSLSTDRTQLTATSIEFE